MSDVGTRWTLDELLSQVVAGVDLQKLFCIYALHADGDGSGETRQDAITRNELVGG